MAVFLFDTQTTHSFINPLKSKPFGWLPFTPESVALVHQNDQSNSDNIKKAANINISGFLVF